jgi:hypothetical protein
MSQLEDPLLTTLNVIWALLRRASLLSTKSLAAAPPSLVAFSAVWALVAESASWPCS